MRFEKYYGIILVILSFTISFYISRLFHNQQKLPSHVKEVKFIDVINLINPPFIHYDNKNYYDPIEKMMSFRSFFFAPGIAVADINQDGWQDFTVISSEYGAVPKVYINQMGKSFLEQSDIWLIDYNEVLADTNISPFLLDYDNDGDVDLFITALNCNKFLMNIDGKFVYDKNHHLNVNCAGLYSYLFADFNQDNNIDILELRYFNRFWHHSLVGYNQDILFDSGPESIFDAKNGGKNIIISNSNANYFMLNNVDRWSFDAVITDLDNDNKDELYIANDFGSDTIYHYDKNYNFTNVSKEYLFPDRRHGMSIATNYIPNNPYPYIYISNIYIEKFVEKGNFYWQYNKRSKKLTNYAEKVNLDNCRWAWGAVFADFNLDGYNDVYIANGFLSSKEGSSKKGDFKLASLASLPFAEFSQKFPEYHHENQNYLGSDEDFIPVEINLELPSVSGNQKDCLRLYDAKEKKFIDFSQQGSLDLAWDGRAVASIDYDNDGDLDLLVTNQNNYLRLLKNTVQEESSSDNWIGFDVQGQQFLKKITIYQGDKTYYKDWNAGHSGFLAMSDPRIHFGLINNDMVTVVFEFRNNKNITKKLLGTGKYYEF